jgi:hypothetical protein
MTNTEPLDLALIRALWRELEPLDHPDGLLARWATADPVLAGGVRSFLRRSQARLELGHEALEPAGVLTEELADVAASALELGRVAAVGGGSEERFGEGEVAHPGQPRPGRRGRIEGALCPPAELDESQRRLVDADLHITDDERARGENEQCRQACGDGEAAVAGSRHRREGSE